MPRPRNARNSGLPPHVYCAKGRYFLRLSGGTEVRLAPASASKREVWEAYLQVPAQPKAATAALTVAALCEQYQRSPSHAKLALQTQRDLARALRTICDRPTGDGRSFGEQLAEHVTRGVIRLYLDSRGVESVTRANREIAYLSSAYSWAAERDLVAENPCRGVRRLKENSRTRYVTDAEYDAVFRLAGARGRSDIQAMMELAYLCRLRENEILRMLDSPAFISPTEGVLAKRGKGSKTQWIKWSPRLEAAIELARAAQRRVPSTMLIVSATRGTPVTISGFRSAWQQLRQAAAKAGAPFDWTFHDLKAKGTSDAEGDRHEASGHRTQRMTEVYDRRIHSTKPTR